MRSTINYRKIMIQMPTIFSFLRLINFPKFIGLIRQPKWGHLKELHAAVNQCSGTLLYGTQTIISLGELQQVNSSTSIFIMRMENS